MARLRQPGPLLFFLCLLPRACLARDGVEDLVSERTGASIPVRLGDATRDAGKKFLWVKPEAAADPEHMDLSGANPEEASPFTSEKDLESLVGRISSVARDAPPVPRDGGPLAVGVRVDLVKFGGLDEVAGTVHLVIDLLLCWEDERLSTELFQTGDRLTLPSDRVWTPDITVLNQVEGMKKAFDMGGTPVVLADNAFKEQTGVNVLWTRRLSINSRCSVDMTHFPFDEQHCKITIGSWASSQRQLMLVAQDAHQDVGAESNIHTAQFQVRDIVVSKKEVYMRDAAERFEEIEYKLVILRFAHFYMVNFILPMVAVTMLAVATMWMTSPSVRTNSSTRLLLCVVQIINITANWRPANQADVWLDQFQAHCLVVSMASVLQSLTQDYLIGSGFFDLPLGMKAHMVDTVMRTSICLTAICVFFSDLCRAMSANDMQGLYASFHGHSSKLLVGFVYLIFMCLGSSSVISALWLLLPDHLWDKLCWRGCTKVAAGVPGPLSPPMSPASPTRMRLNSQTSSRSRVEVMEDAVRSRQPERLDDGNLRERGLREPMLLPSIP